MNFFKKNKQKVQEAREILESFKEAPYPTSEPEEEWIWVEGYKGTDLNMQCNGYQYKLGVQHDIPNDQEVIECRNGFHLCLSLGDVFEYYDIGVGHRFFKVQALVRKSDKDRYGTYEQIETYYGSTINGRRYDKLVSKSIIFESELTINEVLKGTDAEQLPEEYKQLAIATCVSRAVDNYQIDTLVEDGYSKPFACHIVNQRLFDIAHAVGSQKDLSMDMKVLTILYNHEGE